MHRATLGLAAAGLTVSLSASAQVTDFRITPTAGTLSTGQDVVANVIEIDFTARYRGSQILMELTAGEIINVDSPFGGPSNVPPTQGAIEFFNPDLAFDTFLAQGDARGDGPNAFFGDPQLGGGAVNIGGATEAFAVFNEVAKISQAWNPGATSPIAFLNGFVVAQIGLSPDATGTFRYFAEVTANDVDIGFLTGPLPIVDGVILPEPGALGAWLAVSALGLRSRRRRLRSDEP